MKPGQLAARNFGVFLKSEHTMIHPLWNPPSERRSLLIQFAKADAGASPGADAFLEDLIGACVMESTFREHMVERDLLFHDTVAPHHAAYDPAASEAQQRDFLTRLHATLNAPSHPVRQRLDRIVKDSPDLLAVIKQEGNA